VLDSAAAQLLPLLAGCRRADRVMQRQFYHLFYGYALSICLRYVGTREEATEVVNDGFLRVFRGLASFDDTRPDLSGSLRGWLKKIMVRTAIDHFRTTERIPYQEDLDAAHDEPAAPGTLPLEALAYQDLLHLVQQLPPAYRTVFNLYAIDGYKHEEIAQHLGITAGTSKSNLSKARTYLQRLLKKTDSHAYAAYAG
jgi:RNA polymerase sigma factor (sigma-70 family)